MIHSIDQLLYLYTLDISIYFNCFIQVLFFFIISKQRNITKKAKVMITFFGVMFYLSKQHNLKTIYLSKKKKKHGINEQSTRAKKHRQRAYFAKNIDIFFQKQKSLWLSWSSIKVALRLEVFIKTITLQQAPHALMVKSKYGVEWGFNKARRTKLQRKKLRNYN